jgi:hypothetical protein
MKRFLNILTNILVPTLAVAWIIAQIINWNHNVETSGSPLFAFAMVLLGVLVLGFSIIYIVGGTDPVQVIYNGIMWIVNKCKKRK